MEKIPKIKVLKTGIYLAIQDIDRFGFRHYGIPCSGAMDRQSFMYTNLVLGNTINTPLLEIYGQGAKFSILSEIKVFASGAKAEIEINKSNIVLDRPVILKKGDELTIKKLKEGTRIYFGISGGFYKDKILNSISTLSGTHLKPLVKDEILYSLLNKTEPSNPGQYIKISPVNIDRSAKINVYTGPEFKYLSNREIKYFTETKFTISDRSDRMGYTLIGKELLEPDQKEILTSSVMPGTVQLLPNGHLIVLMRECQTTGGYQRVFQLTENAINQLSQRGPGDKVEFEIIF